MFVFDTDYTLQTQLGDTPQLHVNCGIVLTSLVTAMPRQA